MNLLRDMTQVPEEHLFCQELQEPSENAENHECTCRGHQALVKSILVKSNMPKGLNQKLHRLAFTTHLKLGDQIHGYMAKSSGSANQSLRLKPQHRLQLQFSPRLLFLLLLK